MGNKQNNSVQELNKIEAGKSMRITFYDWKGNTHTFLFRNVDPIWHQDWKFPGKRYRYVECVDSSYFQRKNTSLPDANVASSGHYVETLKYVWCNEYRGSDWLLFDMQGYKYSVPQMFEIKDISLL